MNEVIFFTNFVMTITSVDCLPDEAGNSAARLAGLTALPLALHPGTVKGVELGAQFHPIRDQEHQTGRLRRKHLSGPKNPQDSRVDGITMQFNQESSFSIKRRKITTRCPTQLVRGEDLLDQNRVKTLDTAKRDFQPDKGRDYIYACYRSPAHKPPGGSERQKSRWRMKGGRFRAARYCCLSPKYRSL